MLAGDRAGCRGRRAGPTRATLGFALVYLGEHYVLDLLAGARAGRGGPRGWARVAPSRARGGRGGGADTRAGGRMSVEHRDRTPSGLASRRHFDEEPTEEVERQMLLGGRRLLDLRLVIVVDPGGALLRAPEARRARGFPAQDRGRRPRLDRGRARVQPALVRRLHRPVSRHPRRRRRVDRRCASGSTGAPRTRSRSPGWRPRACSRRAGREASRSPTGRCAAPGWTRARRPAGWWRSSCCSTRSICRRS